jgi:hypothetical protein
MNVDEALELVLEWETQSKLDNIKSITLKQISKYFQRIIDKGKFSR